MAPGMRNDHVVHHKNSNTLVSVLAECLGRLS